MYTHHTAHPCLQTSLPSRSLSYFLLHPQKHRLLATLTRPVPEEVGPWGQGVWRSYGGFAMGPNFVAIHNRPPNPKTSNALEQQKSKPWKP